jgi:hypothetical protein
MAPGRVCVASALALTLAANGVAAQSQTTLLLGAGLSVPSGVLADYADRGWSATAGLERSLGTHRISIRLDLSYATNSDTSGSGFHETTSFISAMANIVYHFRGSRPQLYALLGVGYLGRRFSTDDPDDFAINDSQPGFQVGEGIVFRVRSATVFVEGRFVSAFGESPLSYFPVMAGIRIGGDKP